jgi:hypothetical protein
MKQDQIYKVIREALESTVPPVVERVVNGKITKMQNTLDKHIETTEEWRIQHDERWAEIAPILEALRTLESGRKFISWFKPLVLPFAFLVIAAWYFIKGLIK